MIRVGVVNGLGLHKSGSRKLIEQRGVELPSSAGRRVRPLVEFKLNGPYDLAVLGFRKIEIYLNG